MPDSQNIPENARFPGVMSGFRFTLKFKLALVLVSLTVLVLSTFWLTVRNQLGQALQEQADSLGSTLVQQTAESVTELVLANDLVSLNVVLYQLADNENIANVAVFNVDNQQVASAGTPLPRNASVVTAYSAQISLQDSIAGTVRLNLEPGLVLAGLSRYRLYFWSILGLGVALSISAALALAGHISRPLLEVTQWLSDPLEAEPDFDSTRSDELEQLQSQCADLIRQLQVENPPLSLGQGKEEPAETPVEGGSRLSASVMTVQVANINTALELLHPSTLSRLLAQYQQFARQSAGLYGGEVQQFTGASLRLVFYTGPSGDHGFNAVCAAQLFTLLTRRANSRHRAKGSPTLEFKLGLHSGDVFLTAGDGENNQTCMGPAMDISLRLSSLSQAGQILISESTFSRAGTEHQVSVSDSLQVSTTNDDSTFTAYILGDADDAHTDLLQRQAEHILPASDTGMS